MSGKFWTGIALAVAGFALALCPVVSASAAGGPFAPPAAQGGGVVAGVVVHGRPWAGNPGG